MHFFLDNLFGAVICCPQDRYYLCGGETMKQADMRRQGRGWILQVFDPQRKLWVESSEMDFHRARWWVGYHNCRHHGGSKCRAMEHTHPPEEGDEV